MLTKVSQTSFEYTFSSTWRSEIIPLSNGKIFSKRNYDNLMHFLAYMRNYINGLHGEEKDEFLMF